MSTSRPRRRRDPPPRAIVAERRRYGNPFDKGRLFVLFHISFPRNGSLSNAAKAMLAEALPPALDHRVAGADAATLEKLREKNENIHAPDEEPEDVQLTMVRGGMDDFGKGVGADGGDATAEDDDDPRRGGGGGPGGQQGVQCAQQ